MVKQFTAIYKKEESGIWVGRKKFHGLIPKGRTLKEVKENLKEVLLLILETNYLLSKRELRGRVIREPLSISLE